MVIVKSMQTLKLYIYYMILTILSNFVELCHIPQYVPLCVCMFLSYPVLVYSQVSKLTISQVVTLKENSNEPDFSSVHEV